MAQYAIQGLYSQSQPAYPPAKATMSAAAPPESYNTRYLHLTARPDLVTPVPHKGSRLPYVRNFDRLGVSAANATEAKPAAPDRYNRGPFESMGRMSFESSIPAPVPTSTEYKFLPFKSDEEVKFADQDDVPPVSIFSNMSPLELVERLIKGVSDPEKKEGFEAVRKYLLRVELVKVNRPLTSAEETEYGTVVNGLRASALDAFGDGSTQFASQVAYDLGIRFGLARITPPPPPPPGGNGPAGQPLGGPPQAPLFMPPALPAPTPGPGMAPPSSSSSSPTQSQPAAPDQKMVDSLPDDATIDAMPPEDLFPIIGPLLLPDDRDDAVTMFNDWGKLMERASGMQQKHGGLTFEFRTMLDDAAANIRETTKNVIQEYLARYQPVTPAPTPTPPSSPAAVIHTPIPVLAKPDPSGPPPQVEVKEEPQKVKKTGVEVKMSKAMRVMIAADYKVQPLATRVQMENADKVLQAGGDLKVPGAKSAFDSLQGARKGLHKRREWLGPWYKKQDYDKAAKAGLDHPSKLPQKQAGPMPGVPDPSQIQLGSGNIVTGGSYYGGSSGTSYGAGSMSGSGASFLGNPSLRRGLGLSVKKPTEWTPSSW